MTLVVIRKTTGYTVNLNDGQTVTLNDDQAHNLSTALSRALDAKPQAVTPAKARLQ